VSPAIREVAKRRLSGYTPARLGSFLTAMRGAAGMLHRDRGLPEQRGRRRRCALPGVLLAVLALMLTALARPGPAQAAACDYTGFEQPCKVAGGIYRVLVPEGEGPFPVLVYLYGSGGHSVTITNHPIFQETIVSRGYMLVVPGALDMVYYGSIRDTGWALRNEPNTGPRDEIGFLRRVLDDVAQRFPIDRTRILIAGQSRGGFLTWEIACHAPELGSGFAVHAAGYLGPLPQRCQRPVRLLHTHGITDPIVPMSSRRVFSGGAPLPALTDSMAVIARTNGCREPQEADHSEFYGFERQSWPGCSRGSGLDLMLHAGGHMMPWIWFRAILDWFEETPAQGIAAKPVTRTLGGNRPEGIFKSPPKPGEAKEPSG